MSCAHAVAGTSATGSAAHQSHPLLKKPRPPLIRSSFCGLSHLGARSTMRLVASLPSARRGLKGASLRSSLSFEDLRSNANPLRRQPPRRRLCARPARRGQEPAGAGRSRRSAAIGRIDPRAAAVRRRGVERRRDLHSGRRRHPPCPHCRHRRRYGSGSGREAWRNDGRAAADFGREQCRHRPGRARL